jgi:murein DD-endopeptidase MepM/ murein hydrolase activator NlpD
MVVPAESACRACLEFDELTRMVRDGRIEKPAAKERLPSLLAEIKNHYYRSGGQDHARAAWVFPVEGYTAKAVGGSRGSGYKPRGYDYFDGNRHKGHPSQDIFIRDRNQDSLDDRTGKSVHVLSMTGGIVVSVEKAWQPDSSVRGGNYVWVYDPGHEALVYYAHNGEVLVHVGDLVTPGDALATVGRTGTAAQQRRSPTHLHLMYLTVKGGVPAPENLYAHLLKARGGITISYSGYSIDSTS